MELWLIVEPEFQVTASAGYQVSLIDVNETVLQKSKAGIEKNLKRFSKAKFSDETERDNFMNSTLGNLSFASEVPESDLVIEAVTEDLKLKHKIFKNLDEVMGDGVIFASNTSSLGIGEIASVTKRKDRFGGLHFFNPVPMMKLLEVVRIPETSEATYQTMMDWGKSIGKTCITCKDTPGFVVNRLLVSVLAEAARMLDRGDASARDIDIAMKLGAGHPMGPLELCDYVGLDTQKLIMDGWHEKFPDNPLFTPIPILNKLVEDGKYGVKTGEGYYSYKK